MKARRPRAARACDLCRAKKNKCDELHPCSYCKNRGLDCVYRGADPIWRNVNPEYVRQLEDQVKTLTKHLDESTRGRALRTASSSLNNDLSPMMQDEGEHERLRDAIGDGPAATRSYLHAPSRQAKGREVSGVNQYTHNVEFYGASSSVALLFQVHSTLTEAVLGSRQLPGAENGTDACSIVSGLHNPNFSPPATTPLADTPGPSGHVVSASASASARASASAQGSPSILGPASTTTVCGYYPQCRGFLQNFFSTLHYIHPILDKNMFMARCEDLWTPRTEEATGQSFLALYYTILSLGALVGERDDEPIDGIDNIQWSKMFFDAAGDLASRLGMTTNLDMVQCYFFMAKVCQNKLNAHGSYIFVGLAVRTALAMGINRRPDPGTLKDEADLRAESRTWWGLYSLETELSFAMGRPDTLGADAYHNQRFPTVLGSSGESTSTSENRSVEPPYCGIIKSMVDFSRIIRSICLGVYLPEIERTLSKTVAVAKKIEEDLENWVDSLPESIRPTKNPAQLPRCLRNAKEPNWVKRQRLVLTIRYFNVRILLFGSFLFVSPTTIAATASAVEPSCMPSYWTGIQKGLDAAKQTVELIYHTYQLHDFFRTWFYNTTYIVFAASIILVYILQQGSNGTAETTGPWLKLVSMAVEVLESMDECVVAVNAAGILQNVLQRLETKLSLPKSQATATTTSPDHRATGAMAGEGFKLRLQESGDCAGRGGDGTITAFNYHGLAPLSFMDGSYDAGFPLQMADLDGINWLLAGLESNGS